MPDYDSKFFSIFLNSNGTVLLSFKIPGVSNSFLRDINSAFKFASYKNTIDPTNSIVIPLCSTLSKTSIFILPLISSFLLN